MQFTDDPLVKETLGFLMTREISHFGVFSAALETVQPNFPPGVLQGDPRYTHAYFKMSNGVGTRGPWNQGQGPWAQGESWNFIENPVEKVRATNGLVNMPVRGESISRDDASQLDSTMSKQRSSEVLANVPSGENQWSTYPQKDLKPPKLKKAS